MRHRPVTRPIFLLLLALSLGAATPVAAQPLTRVTPTTLVLPVPGTGGAGGTGGGVSATVDRSACFLAMILFGSSNGPCVFTIGTSLSSRGFVLLPLGRPRFLGWPVLRFAYSSFSQSNSRPA